MESSDFFFVLNGFHPSLPEAELRSILETSREAYKVKPSPPMILRINSLKDSINAVEKRAYYVKYSLEELLISENTPQGIFSALKELDLSRYEMRSFRLSLRRLGGAGSEKDVKNIKGRIESRLEQLCDAKRVLVKPDLWLMGFFSGEKFILGKLRREVNRNISNRLPHKRPYFHPSSMHPSLAGSLVNLSRAKLNDVFLDPFCGVGSILLEAGRLGCITLGGDVSPWMGKAAKKNLLYYGVKPSIVVSDARNLPYRKCKSAATDPPYGKNTSTHGIKVEKLVRDFFTSIYDLIDHGGYLCFVSQTPSNILEGIEAGFKHVESHFLEVHGSLEREIAVFRR